eukprot:4773775-Pyramimonas_sp.AAC.2
MCSPFEKVVLLPALDPSATKAALLPITVTHVNAHLDTVEVLRATAPPEPTRSNEDVDEDPENSSPATEPMEDDERGVATSPINLDGGTPNEEGVYVCVLARLHAFLSDLYLQRQSRVSS